MKRFCLFALLILLCAVSPAQYTDGKLSMEKAWEKNLFTGGSVSLAFYNNTFMMGGSPVLGYSLTNWLDAGVVVNYTYTSYRDYNGRLNDKLRQTMIGGGAFARLYPVRFLFAQAQLEQNSIRQKYIPVGGVVEKISVTASSTLIGGGYTSGRQGRRGNPFFYLAVLFDVSGDINSPYTDSYGRAIPNVRGGLQIPLFQGR
jgi:hypothetical protein